MKKPRQSDMAQVITHPTPSFPPSSPGHLAGSLFVSYARGDNTPEGRKREAIVDRLCRALEKRGIRVRRDKFELQPGDQISVFMKELALGDRIYIILSEKYLTSLYCMTELIGIWRNCGLDEQVFRSRVRVYALPEVLLASPMQRTQYSLHWKRERDSVASLIGEHGVEIVSAEDVRRLRHFGREVTDVLAVIADIVLPCNFRELKRYCMADFPVDTAPIPAMLMKHPTDRLE